jgi:hypothetical protein
MNVLGNCSHQKFSRAGGVAQVGTCLASMSLNPRTTKKKIIITVLLCLGRFFCFVFFFFDSGTEV